MEQQILRALTMCLFSLAIAAESQVTAIVNITNTKESKDLLVLEDGTFTDWTYLVETVPRLQSARLVRQFYSPSKYTLSPISFRLQFADDEKKSSTFLTVSASIDPETNKIFSASCTAFGRNNMCTYEVDAASQTIEYNVSVG